MREKGCEAIVVSPYWPGEHGGANIAIKASLKQYQKVFSALHFICITNLPFHDADKWCNSGITGITWFQITTARRPMWLRFVRSLFSIHPAVTVQYSRVSSKVRQIVAGLVNGAHHSGRKISLIFEDIPISCMLPAIREDYPDLPVAVRSHNLLTKAFDGFARDGYLLKKLLWRVEVAKIRLFEKSIYQLIDRLWAITSDEAKAYEKCLDVRPHGVLGIGMDTERYAGVVPGEPTTVVHVGTADLRKGHGLTEFIEQAWPAIRRQIPEACLVLAGYYTEKFSNPDLGIVAMGYVSDDRTILGKGQIIINAQQVGAGLQIKSVVAMLAGKALVSTPTGIEGVEGIDGETFFVAPDTEAMAAQIVALMKDKELALRTGLKARELAASFYNQEYFSLTARPLVEEFANLSNY